MTTTALASGLYTLTQTGPGGTQETFSYVHAQALHDALEGFRVSGKGEREGYFYTATDYNGAQYLPDPFREMALKVSPFDLAYAQRLHAEDMRRL